MKGWLRAEQMTWQAPPLKVKEWWIEFEVGELSYKTTLDEFFNEYGIFPQVFSGIHPLNHDKTFLLMLESLQMVDGTTWPNHVDIVRFGPKGVLTTLKHVY